MVIRNKSGMVTSVTLIFPLKTRVVFSGRFLLIKIKAAWLLKPLGC